MSGIKLQEEINWVMTFKNNQITRPEAEAMVDSRLCAVTIRFDHDDEKWIVEIEREGELVFTKKAALSNRAGVTSCLWHFVGKDGAIPWTQILHGLVWRTETAIIDHRLWMKLEHHGVASVRDLLVLPTDASQVH